MHWCEVARCPFFVQFVPRDIAKAVLAVAGRIRWQQLAVAELDTTLEEREYDEKYRADGQRTETASL